MNKKLINFTVRKKKLKFIKRKWAKIEKTFLLIIIHYQIKVSKVILKMIQIFWSIPYLILNLFSFLINRLQNQEIDEDNCSNKLNDINKKKLNFKNSGWNSKLRNKDKVNRPNKSTKNMILDNSDALSLNVCKYKFFYLILNLNIHWIKIKKNYLQTVI